MNLIEYDIRDGHFEVTIDDVEDFIDMVTIIDGIDIFGARINACDTVRMTFKKKEDGHFDVTYDGANEVESRIWTDWYSTYSNLSRYNIRPDKDPDITTEESKRMVIAADSLFKAKYAGQLTPYHLKRAALGKDFLLAVLIESEAWDNDEDVYSCPEYLAMVKDLDPNDPATVGSGMLMRWAHYVQRDMGDDDITRDINFFKEYKGRITEKHGRRDLAKNISSTLRLSPELFDDDKLAEYLEALKEFCPDYPELIEMCSDAYTAYFSSRPGTVMPDIKLYSTDGSDLLLSSLFGKVIYIDFWATWCGPCIRETPYMAALAERMKGRDDIVCISVSTDDTDEPWQKHLAKEQPDWPQYRADPEAFEGFSKSLNINGIPRFIIVGKDGSIYDPDAIRPSNEDIDGVLLTAAAGDPQSQKPVSELK